VVVVGLLMLSLLVELVRYSSERKRAICDFGFVNCDWGNHR